MKDSLSQFHILAVTATGTLTGSPFPAAKLQNGLTAFDCDVLQDRHELGERQIAHLAPPQGFHPRDIQILKAQHLVVVAQLVRQLKVGVTALVGHPDVRSADEFGRFFAIVRAVRFLVLARLQYAQPAQSSRVMQAGEVGFSAVVGEEGFQSKIEARDFIRRDFVRHDDLLNHTEKQPQASGGIPFDGEGFNSTTHRTMFHKFVGTSADLDLIAVQQLPARLFKGKRFALMHLLVFGWTLCQLFKETLVARVQSFQHILNRLRTKLLPEGIADSRHPQMSDVGFQFTQRNVFSGEAVAAFLQRQGMIPNRTRNVNLLAQMLVAFVAAVQPVLVGFANFDRIGHALTLTRLERWWGQPSRDQHLYPTKFLFYL